MQLSITQRFAPTCKKEGTTLGANDLFIAADARSRGLTLVTNNTGEFRRVPHLTNGKLDVDVQPVAISQTFTSGRIKSHVGFLSEETADPG